MLQAKNFVSEDKIHKYHCAKEIMIKKNWEKNNVEIVEQNRILHGGKVKVFTSDQNDQTSYPKTTNALVGWSRDNI